MRLCVFPSRFCVKAMRFTQGREGRTQGADSLFPSSAARGMLTIDWHSLHSGRLACGRERSMSNSTGGFSRRDFLRTTSAGGFALGGLLSFGGDLRAAQAETRSLKIKDAKEVPSVCPYCAVGCGQLVSVRDGKIINIEGNPESPISRGTLCPKGASLRDDINNTNRILTPKVRRPGSDKWEDISWDEAIAKIARHVKTTRDRTFVPKNAKGQVVNRAPGIAWIGGCTDTNEFNFLQWKAITALGVPYRDSQARV